MILNYLEWEKNIELVFGFHSFLEEEKIELAISKFIDYASIWWDQFLSSRHRCGEKKSWKKKREKELKQKKRKKKELKEKDEENEEMFPKEECKVLCSNPLLISDDFILKVLE